MLKVIVAGGREFDDYDRLCTVLDNMLPADEELEIVSGGAKGADRLGEEFAHTRHISLKIIRANWDKYGKQAGHFRNEVMAEYADMLVAFWDGKSPNTSHMINEARKHGVKVHVECI